VSYKWGGGEEVPKPDDDPAVDEGVYWAILVPVLMTISKEWNFRSMISGNTKILSRYFSRASVV